MSTSAFPYNRLGFSLHDRQVRGAHVFGLFRVDRCADATSGRAQGRQEEGQGEEAEKRAVPAPAGDVPGVQEEGQEKVAETQPGGHQGLVSTRVRGHQSGRWPRLPRQTEQRAPDGHAAQVQADDSGGGGGRSRWPEARRTNVFRRKRQRHYPGHGRVAQTVTYGTVSTRPPSS